MTYQGVGWFGIGVSSDGTMDSNGQGSALIVCEQKMSVCNYKKTVKKCSVGLKKNCLKKRAIMYLPKSVLSI